MKLFLIGEYVRMIVASRVEWGNDYVGFYTSWVEQGAEGVKLYAEFLSDRVGELGGIDAMLKKAEGYGVDVLSACEKAVDIVFNKDSWAQGSTSILVDFESDDVDKLVRVLEYLEYDAPKQYDCLLEKANLLYRHLFFQGKVGCVFKLSGSLSHKFKDYVGSRGRDSRPADEFLLYQALVGNINAFLRWEKIAADYKRNRQQKHGLIEMTKNVEKVFGEILLSFDLLCESGDEQLLLLREMYAPEIFCWMHRLLYETREIIPGNLEKSIRLCERVVDEREGYLDDFKRSGKLDMFVELMRKSAITSLASSNLAWTSQTVS